MNDRDEQPDDEVSDEVSLEDAPEEAQRQNGANVPVLEAQDLIYKYTAQPALLGVSMKLYKGDLAVLVGRNGAGKSTLMRCLAGWTRPNDGVVKIDGTSVNAEERTIREKIVMVPDTPRYYDELTTWEHMKFFAQLHNLEDWGERAGLLLNDFGLWPARLAYPFAFSRGMKYKLGVCLALMVAPDIMILDEPFGPLDMLSANLLWDILADSSENGTTILLSSHALPDDALPDRYYVMEQGRLMVEGSSDDIINQYGNAYDIDEDFTLDDLLKIAVDRFEDGA